MDPDPATQMNTDPFRISNSENLQYTVPVCSTSVRKLVVETWALQKLIVN
jgi:hypothetical protein